MYSVLEVCLLNDTVLMLVQ